MELCYDVDRGEIENVPIAVQTRKETDGRVEYAIRLSQTVVPKQDVHIRIKSLSYDKDMALLDPVRNGYQCTTSTDLITINKLNHNESHTIIINTEDNKIDEGSLETIAYICEITHTVESLDTQYNTSASKLLRIHVSNDDRADLKLQIQDENDSQYFNEAKIKTVGPMCLIENSNITYGITLSSRPGHDVFVYYQLEKTYIDSPLQFQIFPDQQDGTNEMKHHPKMDPTCVQKRCHQGS